MVFTENIESFFFPPGLFNLRFIDPPMHQKKQEHRGDK